MLLTIIIDDYHHIGAPYVISIGRLHPIKGLDRLIRAWSIVEPEFQHWKLKIFGPSENDYGDKLRLLIRELGLQTVTVYGPVFGYQKERLMRQAELFVLSSLSENFGNTVAESLACATAVIASKGTPWRGLDNHGCGWWVDCTIEAIAAALRQAMNLDSDGRRTMGVRGRKWMATEFAWPIVATKMAEVYTWIAQKGDMPECVQIN
jgi:glycosyltransferase involved in cell wall biosynthesis